MLEFLPTHIKIYLYILTFIFGALMGSALNCLAYRMARQQKWSSGRSVCPDCGHTLGLLDLIPIFSWVFLKGKCRYCGAKVSVRYLMTELLMGSCFVSLLWRFDLSLQTVSALVLCGCLFCLSLVDLETQIIPNRFLIIPALTQDIVLLMDEGISGLLAGILPGLILGGGVLIISLIMDKVLKKDTMGGGDIKLLAVLGLFFTVPECLLLLVLACIIGIVMASVLMKVNSETPFPFGPALSVAAWVTLLVGSPIIRWYLNLF